MWKFLNESIDGTSHRQVGGVCQDFSFVTPYRLDDDEFLIIACSDGAGSASLSHVGSNLACKVVARQATDFLESRRGIGEVTENVLREWGAAVHSALNTEARNRLIAPRELACTLLMSIVGRSAAAFFQIGDGAIVILEGGQYRPLFWPQSGEYQNTTYFITDAEFEKHIQFCILSSVVDELALFTDGLQMLALNYAKQIAHEPFFTPMFKALRLAEDAQDLIVQMRQFLDSHEVNGRTDDDKTLVLAVRVPCDVL